MSKNYYLIAVTGLYLLFSTGIISAQYCIPKTTYKPSAYNMYIDSVSLQDINYQDSYSPADTCYNDYTNEYQGQTLLTRGSNYTMTIKGSPYYYNMYYAAWIDYNNDKDFSDTNEKLGEFKTTSANQKFTISFTVPSNAVVSTTRLRVRCVYYYSNVDPCNTYLYGEAEDYAVSISDFLKVGTGITGIGMGEIGFFNYNTDGDYDLILHNEMSSTVPITFYSNSGGVYSLFDYINGDLPELDNSNLSFNLCDLNSDNQLDVLFTYRYSSTLPRTVYFQKQGAQLSQVSTGIPDLMRGTSSAADLNNDGRQDVIICGQKNGDVPYTYIYMNTGTGFTLVNDKLKGVYGQVLTADYDNDRDIDIFLSGIDKYGNTNAIIYRNDNNWQFTNILANLVKADWLARSDFGDYNNDGRLDLIIGEKIFRNDGNDKFTEIYLGIEDWLYDAGHWNDINNDGYLELISQDYHGVTIYKYNRADSFLLDQQLFVDGDNIDIGDYNDDNKQDIITNFYKETYILKNQTAVTNNLPSAPGKLNSYIGDSGYYSVTLKWNQGIDDRTPSKGLSYNLRVGTASGGNDIVSSMTSPTDFSLLKPGMGNVYLNTSWYLKNLKPGKYYWSVQTIDNSGLASPFSAQQQFTILAPLTQSSFLVQGTINAAGAGADFDGDKDIDLIIRDSLLAIYQQVSPYSYSYHKVKRNSSILEIKDLNNDNLPDIIARHNHKIPVEKYDSLSLFINKGNFVFRVINLDTLAAYSVAAADFDNDGDIDLLTHDRGFYLYENIDSLQYNRIKLPLTEILYRSSISPVDIDRDNDIDFIIAGNDGKYEGKCYTHVYENTGNNNFTLSQDLLPGLGPSSFMVTAAASTTLPADIVWNDFNFDGYPDLLITGDDEFKNNNNLIYRNDGTGNLILTNFSPRPANKFSTSWIDFNTDGFPDLIMPKTGFDDIDNIIYLNDKNNTYYGFPNKIDSLDKVMYIKAINADIDKDKDIVCTFKIPVGVDGYTTETKIYTNNNNFINYPPSPPSAITHEIDSFTVILKWNKGLDALTGNEGMTYNIWVGRANNKPDIISPLSDLLTGYRFIENTGNAGTNLSWTIKNLPLGKYYWSVQAIDNSLQGSSWAPVNSFEISALTADFLNDTVCLGFDTHLTDHSVTTSPVISWSWDFGEGKYSSLQNPVTRFTKAGNNPVKLVVRSATSTDSITKNVFVKAIPNSDFTTNVVCAGNPTTFTNSTNINGLAISEWHWDFGDGSGSNVQNPVTHGYLVPGNYNAILVAVADNGCSDTIRKSVAIGVIPTAAITSSGNPRFCYGDSIILSNSYVDTYIYNWQIAGVDITGADSSVYIARESGLYTVKVTNPTGSCQTISSQVLVTKVDELATPVIVTENYQEGKCLSDNPVILSVDQSVTEYSYQWKRNGTPVSDATTTVYQGFLPSGDYSVVVSKEGCKKESIVKTITYNDAPEKPFIYAQGPTVWYLACSNDSSAKYRWYCNGKLIEGADKYFYVANRKMGDYQVSISNAIGCSTMSDIVTIPTGATGIDKVDPFTGLKIFPNPNQGIFTIEMNNNVFGELMIKIITQEGKEIFDIKFEKSTEHFLRHIDLAGQRKGLYLINIKLDKYNTFYKIIIE